jgi:hypothetical protein
MSRNLAISVCLVGLLVSAIAGANAAQYQIVSINGIANRTLTEFYQSPPTGLLVFNSIPFYISPQGPNVLFTEDGGTGSGGPTTGSLSGNLGTSNLVYVLITGTATGNYSGQQMGNIEITHLDSTVENCPLVVGYNIQDWVAVPGLQEVITTTSPNVSTVWTGVSQAGWNYSPALIDMLSIPVNSSSPITGIVINDNSQQLLNNPSPGLFVYGLTLETVPEPSSILALLCGIGGMAGMVLRRKSE